MSHAQRRLGDDQIIDESAESAVISGAQGCMTLYAGYIQGFGASLWGSSLE